MEQGRPVMSFLPDIKVLICYLMERTGKRMTPSQLTLIFRSVGVDYFLINDALDDLYFTGAVINENDRLVPGEKGILSAKEFSATIPLVFRRRVLRTALEYFRSADGLCDDSPECCAVTLSDAGVHFSLSDTSSDLCLVNMDISAPDDMNEAVFSSLRADPVCAYDRIMGTLSSSESGAHEKLRFEINQIGANAQIHLLYDDIYRLDAVLFAPDASHAERLCGCLSDDVPERLCKALSEPPPPVDTDKFLLEK